jgi:hypothetical protein
MNADALSYEVFEAPGKHPPGLRARRLREARKTYASLLARGARLFIGAALGHAGRDVLVLLPRGFDATRGFEARIHYHGMFSTASRPAPEATLPARIAAQWQRGQVVFVFPFAVLDQRSYPNWSPAQSTRRTLKSALDLAGVSAAPKRLIVSGHSAGGSALSYLIKRKGLECDLLILEDCLYNNVKADVIAWGKATTCREVISFHGTNTRWICAPDLPKLELRHVCAKRRGGHYEHVLLDPYASLPTCDCPKAPASKASGLPQHEDEAEFESSFESKASPEVAIRAAALVGMSPFIHADVAVSADNARAICQFVGLQLNIPWQLIFLLMEHEGGVAKLRHKDGVMQTIDVSRREGVKRLPQALKQVLVPNSSLTGAELDKAVLETFARGAPLSRRLCAQIAVGAAELKSYLDRYRGFVALALAAYNTGSGPKAWVARYRSLPVDQRYRQAARVYHQPVSAISVAGGNWICDPNMPGWAWRAGISDKASGQAIRGYQYLRGVASRCSKQPAEACTRQSPKHLHAPCPVDITTTKATRPGSLDKLYDPRLMQAKYRAAITSRWPSLTDDGTPLRAVGTRLEPSP